MLSIGGKGRLFARVQRGLDVGFIAQTRMVGVVSPGCHQLVHVENFGMRKSKRESKGSLKKGAWGARQNKKKGQLSTEQQWFFDLLFKSKPLHEYKPVTPEELVKHREIMKAFHQGCWARDRRLNQQVRRRVRLRASAIEMLPEDLKDEATNRLSAVEAPQYRHIPYLTPPREY